MDPFSSNSSSLTIILMVDPDDTFGKNLRDVLSSQYQLVFTQSEFLSRRITTSFPVAVVFVGQTSESPRRISLIRTLKSDHPSIPVIYRVKKPTADPILSAFRARARDTITDRTAPV